MSGRTMKAVAAAAVTATLATGGLAGCGEGSLKVGAAALVGDDRIAVSTLDRAVRDWQREFRADPMANRKRANPGFGPGAAAEPLSESDLRRALDLLIRIRIADETARRQSIPVSEGRIDQVVDDMNEAGGAASTVRAAGLPARYTRDVARLVAVEVDLGRRFGATPDPRSPRSQAADQRVVAVLTDTARRMRITVNPRFGGFDTGRLTISPVTARLSAPESGIG